MSIIKIKIGMIIDFINDLDLIDITLILTPIIVLIIIINLLINVFSNNILTQPTIQKHRKIHNQCENIIYLNNRLKKEYNILTEQLKSQNYIIEQYNQQGFVYKM